MAVADCFAQLEQALSSYGLVEDARWLMAAELELAAWHVLGNKRWSTFVEPPWSYSVAGGIVSLQVMDKESRLDLLSGRAA